MRISIQLLKKQFHKEFILIRETRLINSYQFWVEIDELMSQSKNSIPYEAMESILKNDDLIDIKLKDGNERIVRIKLKKTGKFGDHSL